MRTRIDFLGEFPFRGRYEWDLIPQSDCDRVPVPLRLRLIATRDEANRLRSMELNRRP